VDTIEVDIYNIIRVYNKMYPCVPYQFEHFLRNTRISFNIYNIVNINLSTIHVLSLFQTFWDPKNVHFHLMYLKYGSIIDLMMTP
jgi:hypothetical protein